MTALSATKKAKKPAGTPVDINAWLDLNSDAIGYDPRFSNPYAVQAEEEAEGSEEGEDAADDKDIYCRGLRKCD